MDQPTQSLEKAEQPQPDVLHGTIVSDPGTPCTPEYARKLTEKALRLADELDNTMQEIVRVRAWEPLGYRDPSEYVLKEFTQSSKSHRYRLARFAAFAYGLTQRLGDDALELKITERALREVPKDRDEKVLNALENRLADVDDPELADEVVADTLRAHSRNAPPADEDMWGDLEAHESTAAAPGARSGAGRSDADGWGDDNDLDPDGFADDDDGAEADVRPAAAAPPSKEALAEAGRYAEFLRAMRLIAAIGGELPGILDNADESEETELLELAEKVGGVAVATSEALIH